MGLELLLLTAWSHPLPARVLAAWTNGEWGPLIICFGTPACLRALGLHLSEPLQEGYVALCHRVERLVSATSY